VNAQDSWSSRWFAEQNIRWWWVVGRGEISRLVDLWHIWIKYLQWLGGMSPMLKKESPKQNGKMTFRWKNGLWWTGLTVLGANCYILNHFVLRKQLWDCMRHLLSTSAVKMRLALLRSWRHSSMIISDRVKHMELELAFSVTACCHGSL